MVQRIIIEGDLVRVLEETEIATASLADTLPLLARPSDLFMSGLPNGVYGIFSDGAANHTSIVIQQPPNMRRITYHPSRHQTPTTYELAFPWIYWIFQAQRQNQNDVNSPMVLQDYRVFCSPNQPVIPEARLHTLPLHNVYNDGRICFGTAAAEMGDTFGQHIDTLINNFWNSTFNDDVTPRRPYSNYRDWQAASQADPNCWRQWPWNDTTGFGANGDTFQHLAQIQPDRTTTITTTNPIPELPMGATWGRIAQWWTNLTSNQRTRLTALAVLGPEQPLTPDTDDPEDEEF